LSAVDEKAILGRFMLELGRLYQAYRMYPSGNPHVQTAAGRCAECLREFQKPIRISRMGEEVVIENEVLSPVPKQLEKILEAFKAMQWDSVRFLPEIGVRGFLEVMLHLKEGEPGTFSTVGFVAGSINLDEEEKEEDKGISAPTGYLTLMPKVQEMMADVREARKGAWVRAREITRLISGHVMAGQDLFSPIMELKDYDEYTFTHAMNVSALSIAAARRMDLPEGLVDAIAIGAICHDVGKEKVPLEVLHKPGRLNEEEREVINRHPIDGAAIIMNMKGEMSPIVPVIAFEHHMRVDGSGYPKLPVQSTPHPAAMLVAVADTFDAIRTVRPYQPSAYTPAGAMSVLIKESRANRLHPVFVSVFARLTAIVVPGRHVKLSDGSRAVVLADGEHDALQPLIEIVDGGEIMDLSMPRTPDIESVEDMLEE
jgi:HD-GYP domain-containing protein (c-di-GMP phosphodiesterase class II)